MLSQNHEELTFWLKTSVSGMMSGRGRGEQGRLIWLWINYSGVTWYQTRILNTNHIKYSYNSYNFSFVTQGCHGNDDISLLKEIWPRFLHQKVFLNNLDRHWDDVLRLRLERHHANCKSIKARKTLLNMSHLTPSMSKLPSEELVRLRDYKLSWLLMLSSEPDSGPGTIQICPRPLFTQSCSQS